MTKEETTKRFKHLHVFIGNHCSDEDVQMFENILALLEQEPCCNCIEFKRYAKEMGFEIEQESSEDVVNRKDVISEIHNTIFTFFDICEDDEESPMNDKDKLLLKVNKAICNNVKAMKPVTPMPKRGHWVANHDESDDSHTIDCSYCGYTLVRVVNTGYTSEQALDCAKDMTKNYCPNCGTEMEEE